MIDLWATRRASEAALEGSLQLEAGVVAFGFRLIDRWAAALSRERAPFSWVCIGVLAKARHLALSYYSLSLDGSGQEAGALLRPLLETTELLLYFAQDTSRVQRVIQDGQHLPKAGEIAKAIGSQLKPLRDYLNDHASHFSFTDEAVRHLYDEQTNGWRMTQPYDEGALVRQLKFLWAALSLVSASAVQCVVATPLIEPDLLEDMRRWHELSVATFHIVHKGEDLTDATLVTG